MSLTKPTNEVLSLAEGVILRREYFGGLAFDTRNGNIIRHVPAEISKFTGYKGCVAGDRILAVSPSGDLYPCSQLIYPRMKAGNILADNLQEVWDKSRVLKKYRFFRKGKTFTESWCGICTQKETCGGCRVFAPDALGGDPGCPEPLPIPINQLGKKGRLVNLTDYFNKSGGITAREYMERYGVGERKAIKELNLFTGIKNRSPKFKYTVQERDIVFEIQDSIGYTSGGAPFASAAEIREWLGLDMDGYPEWMM